jgi:FKBP-type peptidyl-prolyl cis-trans isomerase SlyD
MSEEKLTVGEDVVVSMQYQVSLADGREIERTERDAPLQYLHGRRRILPALERELIGMSIGDEKEVKLRASEAYGERDPEDIVGVDRNAFPESLDLTVGRAIAVRDEETQEAFQATVVKVDPEKVVLDFNHPLAGEALEFKIKIVGLRNATEEELVHGHAHGESHSHA